LAGGKVAGSSAPGLLTPRTVEVLELSASEGPASIGVVGEDKAGFLGLVEANSEGVLRLIGILSAGVGGTTAGVL